MARKLYVVGNWKMYKTAREATDYIASSAAPGDRIYYGPPYLGPIVTHYLPSDRSALPSPRHHVVRQDDVDAILDTLSPTDATVWVLRSREWSDDPSGLLARGLTDRFPTAVVRKFAGVTVYRLDPGE